MDKAVILILLLILVFPLLLFELPVVLNIIPRIIQKFLCFVPCGTVIFFAVKILLERNIGVFLMLLFFFCITLYGGFVMKDLIVQKD